MVEPVTPIELLPGETNFLGLFSGDSLQFSIDWPWDATDETHQMLISDDPTGVAEHVLTDGHGLTVHAYAAGVTTVDVDVDSTILANAGTYYWQYKIDSVTQMFGRIETTEGLSAT